MSEEIVKVEGEIIPLDNPKKLSEYFSKKKPQQFAQALTGALKEGKAGMMVVGGRLLEAYLSGNFGRQFAQEFESLIQEGKIKENYAETTYGLTSLVDLLKVIDTSSDIVKIKAVKAMFYSTIKVDIDKGSEILNYELFQIAQKLNSSQILVLRVAYSMGKLNKLKIDTPYAKRDWAKAIAYEMGHKIMELVEKEEEELVSKRLLKFNPSGYFTGWGLTSLGIRFCQNMDTYYSND